MNDLYESLRRMFVNNPNGANKLLIKRISDLKKGDSILINSPIPKALEKKLVLIAKRKGIKLTFSGKAYSYFITTVEDKLREQKEAEQQREILKDWLNSPG